jgi:hypothetical protein
LFLLLVLPLRQMFYLSEFLARTWKIGFDVDVKFWTCFAIAAGDLPDGQISKNAVHTQSQKYSASRLTRLKSISPAVLSHSEGRFANVTDVGAGCDGRCGARDGRCRCGRRSRVVLTPRRWCQVGGSNSADDGGKRARSPGSAKEAVKTIARGCRAFSGVTVVTNARVYYTTRAAAGASGARHPCAL